MNVPPLHAMGDWSLGHHRPGADTCFQAIGLDRQLIHGSLAGA